MSVVPGRQSLLDGNALSTELYAALALPVGRLEGTNAGKGKEIMNASGLNVIAADDLDDAAQKIVAAVKEAA